MKLLKLLVIAGVFGTLALSGGCRKKTETEMDMATKPLHCYNQEMDADETLPDFGGSCGTGSSTVSLASDCGMADNTAKIIADPSATTTNYTVVSCVKTVSGSYFTYNITLNGGRYIHLTTTSDVIVNHNLDVVSGTPSANDECAITYYMSAYSGSGSSFSDTGVSIKYNGTTYVINICSMSWYSGFGSGIISALATVN